MTTFRLMIVDDDPMVLVGLKYVLRGMPGIEIVAEASDGADILPILRSIPVDVVLSDIRMRRSHGTSMIPAIRAHSPGVRVVLMSSLDDPALERHALNAGADAFVAKSMPPRLIHAALTGQLVPQATIAGRPLSEREATVAASAAAGASNAEIGAELGLSVNSVKTYVSRVMSKLGVTNRVQLANVVNRSADSDTGHRRA